MPNRDIISVVSGVFKNSQVAGREGLCSEDDGSSCNCNCGNDILNVYYSDDNSNWTLFGTSEGECVYFEEVMPLGTCGESVEYKCDWTAAPDKCSRRDIKITDFPAGNYIRLSITSDDGEERFVTEINGQNQNFGVIGPITSDPYTLQEYFGDDIQDITWGSLSYNDYSQVNLKINEIHYNPSETLQGENVMTSEEYWEFLEVYYCIGVLTNDGCKPDASSVDLG